MSIMKFAVCSRSSTAIRSPPSVMRGTPAVACPPDGDCGDAHAYCLSRCGVDGRRLKFGQDDTDQLALGAAERGDDVFHAVVDVEAAPAGSRRARRRGRAACGRPRSTAWPGRRGSRDRSRRPSAPARSPCGWRRRPWRRRGAGGRQDRNSVRGLDGARGPGADAEPAETAGLALAEMADLVRQRVCLVVGVDHQHPGAVARRGERDVQRGDAAVLVESAPITAMHGRGVRRPRAGPASRASRAWR